MPSGPTALERPAALPAAERERRTELAEMLRELLSVLNSHRSLGTILDHVLERVTDFQDADAGAIYLLDTEDGETFLRVGAARGLSPDRVALRLPLGSAVSGLAARERRPTTISNIREGMAPSFDVPPIEMRVEDRGSHLHVHHLGGPGTSLEGFLRVQRLAATHPAALAVPLIARDETYGALTLFYSEPRDFSADDVALATAFAEHAALAVENTRLRDDAEQRTRDSERRRAVAEGLAELMGLVNSGADLEAILHSAMAQAANLLRSDASAGYVLGDVPGVLVRRASYGPARTPLPKELAVGALGSGAYTDLTRGRTRKHFQGMLALPLSAREQTYGAIALFYRAGQVFSAEEMGLAASFASQAGLALDNVRLHEQAQHAAALEERQRLARELHDAVTQTLFSASLIAEVLPRVWDADPTKGRQHLEELRRLTRGAMAEMRTLLVELRPGALNDLGLGDLLRQLGEATMGRAELHVAVSIEAASVPLAPDLKLGLYRIAQEALNNVVKHARAQHASIALRQRDGAFALSIEDDGRGFDPVAIPAGHLGVGIMAERASALKATLRVDSAPGAGTRVWVTWPAGA